MRHHFRFTVISALFFLHISLCHLSFKWFYFREKKKARANEGKMTHRVNYFRQEELKGVQQDFLKLLKM